MDTLPISNLPIAPAPPNGESTAEAATPTDAPPGGGFEAALARSLAGFAKAPADTGAAPDASGDDSAETADTTLLADLTAGALTTSDSAAALLAALPHQLARADPPAPGESSAMGPATGSRVESNMAPAVQPPTQSPSTQATGTRLSPIRARTLPQRRGKE
jgi:hypothetical protein